MFISVSLTYFDLYVFLSNHEGHWEKGLRHIQEDDGWKLIPFSRWLELSHLRTYADQLGGRESYSIAQDEPNNGDFRNAKVVGIQIQH